MATLTVSVVFAIFGAISLLIGLLGGGIKAEKFEIPFLTKTPRILAGAFGLALIVLSVYMTFTNPQASPATASQTPIPTVLAVVLPGFRPSVMPATATSTATATVIPPTSTPTLVPSTETPTTRSLMIGKVFSLDEASVKDFYPKNNAKFFFNSYGALLIQTDFTDGVYLRQELPEDFQLKIQFKIQDPSANFYICFGDGSNTTKAYCLRVSSTNYSFTETNLESTKYIKWSYDNLDSSDFQLKPKVTNEISLVRKNGDIAVDINDSARLSLEAPNTPDMEKYNYLYLGGISELQVEVDQFEIVVLDE